MLKTNEIYSDEIESEKERIELVNKLDEKNTNENNLEELLKKSSQLNSSKSIRLINKQLLNIPTKSNKFIENYNLSCNFIDKYQNIHWNSLPKHLQTLELSGNFLKSLNGIENNNNQYESLGFSYNDIENISQIFSNSKWLNLCLIDLSYNLLNNLKQTIDQLKSLNKLRILYLHGNPLALLVDYRLFVVDSLENLVVLDDITITSEERFRARYFSNSNEHPKDYAQFSIQFGTIFNLPQPTISQNEWPLEIHRYFLRFQWFEGEKQDIDIPIDKFSNFNRFNSSFIQSSYSDYKINLDFNPNHLNFQIKSLISFRDFLFHGTTCYFIHQMTEYWSPDQINEEKLEKKKSNKNSEKKDKKIDLPVKKKKNEDLNKLIILKDPIEQILVQFHIDLRLLLDGDYQISFPFQTILKQDILSLNIQENISKKITKDKQKDKKTSNENSSLSIPQPFQCSIHFQLHRFISNEQLI